jgi:preprotein translocase subunit SecD
MNIILISLLFLFGNTIQLEVKPNSKLVTGWYYIIEEDKGVKRQLDKTENFYFLDPTPIVTAKSIKKIEFRNDNEGKPYLAMLFDAYGTKAWSKATGKWVTRKLGFILNDQLIQAPTVNSQITGGVAAIWDYSKSELEHFKKSIEISKKKRGRIMATTNMEFYASCTN